MAGKTTYLEGAQGCNIGQLNINHQVQIGPPGPRLDLHPITDASHTRNRKLSPPNSICFQGTREGVIREIIAWALSSLSDEARHILWVFGYAGCGKSAIAQVVATQLEASHRLGASFFFFRGAGDRSRIMKFAETIASQIAASIDGTARHIQAALAAHPDMLEATTSPVVQFNRLVLNPVRSAAGKWYRLNGIWRPVIVVIDGFDECEDKDEASNLVQDMAGFFAQKPGVPLRFIIMSRVEDHLYKKLHNSNQVRLLNLVDRTSDEDISTALDAAIAAEEGGRAQASHAAAWLSSEDKKKLIEHIGGSFIFMTTIVKFLFAPFSEDGLTPRSRLPLALNMNPGFDGLYKAILERNQSLPHLVDIIGIIALARRPLSAVEIADFVGAETVAVVSVLIELHAIIQVPDDDHTPITLWHSSLHDFLNDHNRSAQFFASPRQHELFTARCIDLAFGATSHHGTPASAYSKKYVLDHFEAVMAAASQGRGGGFRAVMARVRARDAFFSAMPSRVVDMALSLMQAPISVVEIADLLDSNISDVAAAAQSATGVDDFGVTDPISFPAPLRAFTINGGLPGAFWVLPEDHERLTLVCIAHAFSMCDRPSSPYALRHVWSHYRAAIRAPNARRNFPLVVFLGTRNKYAFLAAAPIDIRNDVYWAMIAYSADLPHFFRVLQSDGGSSSPLSIADVGGTVDPECDPGESALQNLQKVFEVPREQQSPIVHQYPSFYDFLSAQHTAAKPRHRAWKFQPHLGPLEVRDTDVIIPVIGDSKSLPNSFSWDDYGDITTTTTPQFINALLGSIGQALGASMDEIRPVVISGPKWGYDRLQDRRIVLVDCPGLGLEVEDDIKAAKQLHEWWKGSYPHGKVCGGVIYLINRTGNPARARIIGRHTNCLANLCGVAPSAMTFVIPPYFPETTIRKEILPRAWADIDSRASMRVMTLQSDHLETESAWDILDSILRVADGRVADGTAFGGQKEGENGHSACDRWLASELSKSGTPGPSRLSKMGRFNS